MRNLACIVLFASFFLFSCEDEGVSPGSSSDAESLSGGVNQGGSMARFSLSDDRLYIVSPDKLSYFDVSNPEKLDFRGDVNLTMNAETVFPYQQYLFMGTSTGMLIYDVSDVDNPVFVNQYEHVLSCDPVVVQNDIAYVTLRNGTECWGVNELHVLDVSDLTDIKLLSAMNMSHPHGLGIDGSLLAVCEGHYGLSLLNAEDPNSVVYASSISGHYYDIIMYDQLAITVGENHLTQYRYSPQEIAFEKMSTMDLVQK